MMKKILSVCLILGLLLSCESLELDNNFNPGSQQVISTGDDLQDALQKGYLSWWSALHRPAPALSLAVAGDAYSLPWEDFGAAQMGQEPREAFQNNTAAPEAYRQIAEGPWYGCLGAVSDANEVLRALENGISLDKGGPQDQSVRASAHALRGLAWGYLALLFDQAPLVEEDSDLEASLDFVNYPALGARAVEELETAAGLAEGAGIDFLHNYFNGVLLDAAGFQELCHAYAARFLVQMPRTPAERTAVDWEMVATHAEQGLSFDFAPEADGGDWVSYQSYTQANTGEGPFWARVDQRLIAAMDSSQPARYPEVEAAGEPPLASTQAFSADERLETDFLYAPNVPFPAERGEWHFSHYQHRRHESQPELMGNGSAGPMPTFLRADCELLLAEAWLFTNRKAEAVALLNQGSRVQRGGLPTLSTAEPDTLLEQAIRYERAIELLNTAPMGLWLDRRRWAEREPFSGVTPLGGLQLQTPAQLPVPARELQVNGMELYSFGGGKDPEGVEPFFY